MFFQSHLRRVIHRPTKIGLGWKIKVLASWKQARRASTENTHEPRKNTKNDLNLDCPENTLLRTQAVPNSLTSPKPPKVPSAFLAVVAPQDYRASISIASKAEMGECLGYWTVETQLASGLPPKAHTLACLGLAEKCSFFLGVHHHRVSVAERGVWGTQWLRWQLFQGAGQARSIGQSPHSQFKPIYCCFSTVARCLLASERFGSKMNNMTRACKVMT